MSPSGSLGSHRLIEGLARVVAKQDGDVVMEPEQVNACDHCHMADACGSRGGITQSKAKRFPMHNDFGGEIGDRIVVGIAEGALLRASLVAYGIPLAGLILGGVAGQAAVGSDAGAAICAIVALIFGMGVARLVAKQLTRKGDLSPRFLRHAGTAGQGDDECPLE